MVYNSQSSWDVGFSGLTTYFCHNTHWAFFSCLFPHRTSCHFPAYGNSIGIWTGMGNSTESSLSSCALYDPQSKKIRDLNLIQKIGDYRWVYRYWFIKSKLINTYIHNTYIHTFAYTSIIVIKIFC